MAIFLPLTRSATLWMAGPSEHPVSPSTPVDSLSWPSGSRSPTLIVMLFSWRLD